jgi:hypothetical protein
MRFYGGAVASFLRRGWKPLPAELAPLGNPPSESDDWEEAPHAFYPKPWGREGDPGYDGDPESCALCHRTEGNPIHV